jgi:division protein CdvB (Snf7/Vps24/ESCRT-III family)
LSSRIDGASSRIAAALQMKQVTKSMAGVVGTLDKAMKGMDINMVQILIVTRY